MRLKRVRRTHLLIGVLVLCLAVPAFSQTEGKPRIAILPLKATGVSASVMQSVTSLIERALIKTKAYTVVSSKNRDQALEPALLAGCDEADCAVKIGGLLSARHVVAGNITTQGNKAVILVRIYETASGRILAEQTADATAYGELEAVCTQLAYAAAASALPGAELAKVPPPAIAVKPSADKPEGAKTAAEAKPLVPVSQGDSPAGTPDLLGLAAMSGGIVSMEIGNALGPMYFETMKTAGAQYRAYLEASMDFDALYAAYSGTQTLSTVLGITSYSLLGLGAAGMSAGTIFYPSGTYGLSPLGRIAFAAGLAGSVSGSVLSLMAGNQYFTNVMLYDQYMGSPSEFDVHYQAYQAGYTAYGIERISAYSLWGLGGAAMAGSFFLPGEKSPAADGPLNKILYAGGMALVSGGGFVQSMALNSRQSMEEKYKVYLKAASNLETLYADYSASYGSYILYSGLSYGMLVGGAAAVITSLFVPFGGPAAQMSSEPPIHLSVIPYPDGIGVWITLRSRRS